MPSIALSCLKANTHFQRVARLCCLASAAFLLTTVALAQTPDHQQTPDHPHKAEEKAEEEKPFEVFAGYSYVREDGNNLNGWTGTFIANINKWFGIAADFDGHYGSHKDGAETVTTHENGFTFGPHVAIHTHSKVTPFAFALLGGAHKSEKVGSTSESATGFAGNFGGGFDLGVNEQVSIRLIQVDAAYTRFKGIGATSPRISAGIIFHFGKGK
jgi:hypothetical protein